MDTVTNVTHQSYGSRVGSSIKGMLIGPLFIIGSIFFMVWNEGNAVTAHRSLYEAARATVSVDSVDNVDPSNEAKLVHLVGRADTTEDLYDSTFGVTTGSPMIKLKRNVEMYQWVQHSRSSTKKNTGGSSDTTNTYTYTKEWRSSLEDSSHFFQPTGHKNPTFFPYPPTTIVANTVTFGAFTLHSSILDRMNWFSAYTEPASLDNIPDDDLRNKAHVVNNGFYVGTSPTAPAVGDSRVSYQDLPPQTISILAQQVGSSFAAYSTKAGKPVLLVESGSHTAKEMFQHAQAEATAQAWLFRIVGFVLLWLGLLLLVRPLSVMADVLPCVGNLVEGIITIATLPIALVVTGTVVALSWLAYRPLLAIPFLLAVGFLAYWVVQKKRTTGSTPQAYVVAGVDEEDLELQPNYPYKL